MGRPFDSINSISSAIDNSLCWPQNLWSNRNEINGPKEHFSIFTRAMIKNSCNNNSHDYIQCQLNYTRKLLSKICEFFKRCVYARFSLARYLFQLISIDMACEDCER